MARRFNGKVSNLVGNEKQTEGRNVEGDNYSPIDQCSPLSPDDGCHHNSSDSFVYDQVTDDVVAYPVEDFHGSQEPVKMLAISTELSEYEKIREQNIKEIHEAMEQTRGEINKLKKDVIESDKCSVVAGNKGEGVHTKRSESFVDCEVRKSKRAKKQTSYYEAFGMDDSLGASDL